MRRRALVAAIAAAAAWPLTNAATKQPNRFRRIGVLTTFAEDDPLAQRWMAAFRKGLEEASRREGPGLQIDYRWAAGDPAGSAASPNCWSKSDPTLFLPSRRRQLPRSSTRTQGSIPIVFAEVSDPIGSRFVEHLARPGGNVTGFTDINIEPSLGGKMGRARQRDRARNPARDDHLQPSDGTLRLVFPATFRSSRTSIGGGDEGSAGEKRGRYRARYGRT